MADSMAAVYTDAAHIADGIIGLKQRASSRVSSRISRLVISQDGAVEGTTAITLWPDVGVRFWIAGHGRVADAITGCHGPSKAGSSACIAGGR